MAFLALMAASWGFFTYHLVKYDPALVRRRMRAAETEPLQKLFQRLFLGILLLAFLLAGFDHRFGWTHAIRPIPFAAMIAGHALTQVGYWFVFWVTKTNTFAASTIQVEAEQKVIDRGPYAVVRHPMYLGMSMALLGIPLSLGSYVALPVFVLFVPLFIFRLIHEERTLRIQLAGYSDYCQRTLFRLIPLFW